MKGIKGMACLFFLVVCGLCFCEPAFKAGDVNVEGNGVSVPFYLEEATVLPIGIQAKILYENSVLQPEYVEVEADNQMFCANFDTAGVIDIAGLSLDFVPFEIGKPVFSIRFAVKEAISSYVLIAEAVSVDESGAKCLLREKDGLVK